MERTCPDAARGPGNTFRTPLVPWLPGLGAAFNWFLLAQLTWQGLWMVGCYILASLLLYFAYGYRHSVGATSGCVRLCAHCCPSTPLFHVYVSVSLSDTDLHAHIHVI